MRASYIPSWGIFSDVLAESGSGTTKRPATKEDPMSHAAAMLGTRPSTAPYDTHALAHCIDACFDCAQTCTACADACLGEETVAELRRCVSIDLTCGDVCVATGSALSRSVTVGEAPVRRLLQACAEACAACAEECERHAQHHEHCRICAEVCRECESRCRELLGS
jgi:hypothetical protein